MRDKLPVCLHSKLSTTAYHERRKPNRLLFFDKSKTKLGFQGIQNRIGDVFNQFDFDNYPVINDDQLRINLKKSFNF